jgi:hypothetical protein
MNEEDLDRLQEELRRRAEKSSQRSRPAPRRNGGKRGRARS